MYACSNKGYCDVVRIESTLFVITNYDLERIFSAPCSISFKKRARLSLLIEKTSRPVKWPEGNVALGRPLVLIDTVPLF